VVAIGDFDADGRSDLYWRNSQTGRNDMWLMNGTVLKGFATVYNEPNQSWQIVNSGDYNGDGYTDVLWRNSSTGDNYMMLMQGTVILGSSAMLQRVADLNWRMTGMRGSN
jgi:peptidyl-Asp metalloendopeptidase